MLLAESCSPPTLNDRWLQINADSTELAVDSAAATEAFAARQTLICRDMLGPSLKEQLAGICARAHFVADPVHLLGHRSIEQPPIAGNALRLILRRAPLFQWLEQVTGCPAIRTVEGRVVETGLSPEDGLAWHDDLDETRRLAITIALGEQRYEGGEFELRRKGETDVLLRFHHDMPWTALIFVVSSAYEHRLAPLVSGGPRRVFAGWFVG